MEVPKPKYLPKSEYFFGILYVTSDKESGDNSVRHGICDPTNWSARFIVFLEHIFNNNRVLNNNNLEKKYFKYYSRFTIKNLIAQWSSLDIFYFLNKKTIEGAGLRSQISGVQSNLEDSSNGNISPLGYIMVFLFDLSWQDPFSAKIDDQVPIIFLGYFLLSILDHNLLRG